MDWPAYEALVRAQVAARVAGVVPCGTTGESPTLTASESARLISDAVRLCAGTGVRVLAGTGSNSTAEACARTVAAAAAGADGALLVTPYYNKPSQAGLAAHVAAVAAAAPNLPLVLYNVPGRSSVSMAPATVASLRSALPRSVVAVKEASGSLDAVSDIAAACDIAILSGDDALTVPMMSLGARGVVSVASNLRPAAMVALVDAAARGDYQAAAAQHRALLPTFRMLFCETNPAPAKLAMHWARLLPSPTLRLPLVPVDATHHAKIRAVVDAMGDDEKGPPAKKA